MVSPERAAAKAERRAVRRALIAGTIRAVVTVAIILAAYYLLPVGDGYGADSIVRMAIGAIAVIVVATWEVSAVAKSPKPEIRAIDAIAVSAATMTVAFAVLYLNLSARDPDAFTEHLGRTAALYFTMTTLTTVGYGDITARTDAARVAVMTQFLFNVAVIGTTARLIVGTVRRSAERRSM